ncbi:hypothetical protein BDV95DRAFT_560674 [Massariosphaeria phaeospora]|uniref:RING-type domain-containing protein n=1 Tax=Massariosphaeria phaeospora TaxID=100035 RepID=A0A7C8MTB5_9PLEO|nr:hypothetical protein BDV95DRAFT_560674 [Massariosphaeria phaeospora]
MPRLPSCREFDRMMDRLDREFDRAFDDDFFRDSDSDEDDDSGSHGHGRRLGSGGGLMNRLVGAVQGRSGRHRSHGSSHHSHGSSHRSHGSRHQSPDPPWRARGNENVLFGAMHPMSRDYNPSSAAPRSVGNSPHPIGRRNPSPASEDYYDMCSVRSDQSTRSDQTSAHDHRRLDMQFRGHSPPPFANLSPAELDERMEWLGGGMRAQSIETRDMSMEEFNEWRRLHPRYVQAMQDAGLIEYYTDEHGGETRDVPLVPSGPRINTQLYTTPVTYPAAGAECGICLDGPSANAGLVKPRDCEHTYHLKCLDAWVNSAQENSNTCPTCRKQFCSQRRELRPDFNNPGSTRYTPPAASAPTGGHTSTRRTDTTRRDETPRRTETPRRNESRAAPSANGRTVRETIRRTGRQF